MVHIWGFSGSISGLHFRVNKWSTSEITIKIVVSEDFINKVFRKGFECFVAFWCSVSKTGFLKRGW